jgi:hypothetical protein
MSYEPMPWWALLVACLLWGAVGVAYALVFREIRLTRREEFRSRAAETRAANARANVRTDRRGRVIARRPCCGRYIDNAHARGCPHRR